MTDSRIRLIIKGRVQGVFYRLSTKKKANYLSLGGWVKNLARGDVEVVAEGKKENLERLIAWARQGPPGARVDDIDVSWEEFTGEFNEFSIRY
ncbi:acylphosphatase [Candidatus Woesearchaeota archaeon]|nr:acylphosphatase [Candidatus Woesearchaeota archaeon]